MSQRSYRTLFLPLLPPMRYARWYIIGSICSGWGKFLLPLVVPWAAAGIIDRVIPMALQGEKTAAWEWFSLYISVCAVACCLMFVCTGLRAYWAILASSTVHYLLRQRLFEHVQRLSMAFFSKHHAGALGARVSSDLAQGVGVVERVVIQYSLDVVFVLVVLCILLTQHWFLALLLLLFVCINGAILFRFGPQLREKNKSLQETISRITGQAAEVFSAISLVKALAGEKETSALFDEHSERALTLQRDRARLHAIVDGLSFTLMTVTSIVMLLVGTWIVIAGTDKPSWIPSLTVGTLVGLNMYIASLMGSAQRMIDGIAPLQESLAALDRIGDLLEQLPDPDDAPDAVSPPLSGNIRLRNVTFAYRADRPVLHDLSLDLQAGRSYALVGGSGGGKSSICQLLLRFWDPQSGAVEVDGVDLRRIRQSWWRSHVAVVLQDPIIFSCSVRDNIDFAVDNATQEQVERAARAAQAHDFITALPDGYATRVGERGASLSGGQRQRIAIARALMRNPKLLILDEATSALDSTTERAIQQVIDSLHGSRTMVVIAHRLSTIRNVDEILVMEQGRLVERGNWDELRARGGRFAELLAAQDKPAES